jgi:hypothetical protein
MTVVEFPKREKQPEQYVKAMTVQHLIDRLGFCDRKARIYIRHGWMAGAIDLQEYPNGVYGKPTVLLYLNEKELS